MATYQSLEIQRNRPRPMHGDAAERQQLHATVQLTAALATNDVIQLGYLPINAVCVGGFIQSDQLDTGTGLTINVGDNGWTNVAADTARYFTASVAGRGANGSDANADTNYRGRARGFKNTSGANLLVFATVTAGATAGQAGNYQLFIDFVIEEPASIINPT